MNNAQLEIEQAPQAPIISNLSERKVYLLRMIEAIDNLSKNEDWRTVKELLFDGQLEKLETSLLNEVKANELSAPKIYRLQGNLEWAKRFDLYKLAETYKVEINNITKKLNENVTTI